MASGEYHEPMMTSSPSSPGVPQSPYLPGYLLGESNPHGISGSPRLWSGASASPRSFSSPMARNPGLRGGTPRSDVLKGKDKSGAPPVKSLFSPMDSPHLSTPSLLMSSRDAMTPASRGLTPGPPTTGLSMGGLGVSTREESFFNQSHRMAPSPAQLDPFYTQGENLRVDDVLDDTWVTVFGFPPGSASFILQQFAQYGNILQKKIFPECNWMHMQFQSRIQAKKALSKNGKLLNGTIMIGVTPCIDKSVMENSENLPSTPVTNPDTSLATAGTPSAKGPSTPIRPLTAAYQAARSEYEVAQSSGTPKKDNGLVSKMKEYVLGW